MEYLKKRGIIKQVKGNFGESLVVTGTYGNARGKQRYVNPTIYNQLLKTQLKDKLDEFFNSKKEIFSKNYKLIDKINSSRDNEVYYIFDYAIFETNYELKFLIELYNGDYCDKFKINFCKNNNIKLLRIKYDQFVNIEETLSCECVS